MNDKDKLVFIAWLDRQIVSSEAVLGQFEKQGFLCSSVKEVMSKKERTELAAYKVVRKVLEDTKSFTLS